MDNLKGVGECKPKQTSFTGLRRLKLDYDARACSSAGRATPLQGEGQEFESPQVHQKTSVYLTDVFW